MLRLCSPSHRRRKTPTKIQLSVNGVATTDWALNGNQIVLTGMPIPAAGSIVTVTYQEGC